jgi:hypothetical protein
MRIAILGWGSLIWDPGALALASEWTPGGPTLPIEFSRVSRNGRLTLVIDPVNGDPVTTRFAISRRETLQQAIRDLQTREITGEKFVGFVDLRSTNHRCRHDSACIVIRAWAVRSAVDAAIWTDLPSNFLEATGCQFSVDNALSYLAGLSGSTAELARSYIERAPVEVDTEVRRRASRVWRTIEGRR